MVVVFHGDSHHNTETMTTVSLHQQVASLEERKEGFEGDIDVRFAFIRARRVMARDKYDLQSL
jgi:hypothetical protein